MPGTNYLSVENIPALREMCAALDRDAVVALDLEADTLFHYGETPCLAQFSNGSETWLVDLIRLADISCLGPLLENPAVEKILHGADYDIRLLRRHYGIDCRPVFDTEIAARFLGMRQSGLSRVLEKYFGVALEKKFQKRDWTQRPLPAEMRDYAAADVRWLVRLAGLMKEELVRLGRLDWFEEECSFLASSPDRERKNEPLFLRFKGAELLDRRSLAVLESLLQAREALARERDRPPFKVLSNEAIGRMAVEHPETDRQLVGNGPLGRRSAAFRAVLLSAVKGALALPESRLPEYPVNHARRPARDARFRARVQNLKQWREKRAGLLGLDVALVCTNGQIDELAEKCPLSPGEMKRIEGLREWQKREFGGEIRAVLSGAQSA